MAEYIPTIVTAEGKRTVDQHYNDASIARVSLYNIDKLKPDTVSIKLWVDCCVDGLHDISSKKSTPGNKNDWYEFMAGCQEFTHVVNDVETPNKAKVASFVSYIMDKALAVNPSWITIPQYPFRNDNTANKMNRLLAKYAGDWKSSSGFNGELVLPGIFTNQKQLANKVDRNPRIAHMEGCYQDSGASVVWLVDQSLDDDSGSPTLRNKRFPSITSLHEEVVQKFSPKVKLAGPYWGLNLALWTKGLVDHPLVGLASGYQYYLSGGRSNKPKVRIVIPCLKRLVEATPQFKQWVDLTLSSMPNAHPAYNDLLYIQKNYTYLNQGNNAKKQIAQFYKLWIDSIQSKQKNQRAIELFQQLASAFATGRLLTDIPGAGVGRRPEAVAESLMTSCI